MGSNEYIRLSDGELVNAHLWSKAKQLVCKLQAERILAKLGLTREKVHAVAEKYHTNLGRLSEAFWMSDNERMEVA